MGQEVAPKLSMILILVDIAIMAILYTGIRDTPEWQDFKDSIRALWKRIVE